MKVEAISAPPTLIILPGCSFNLRTSSAMFSLISLEFHFTSFRASSEPVEGEPGG